MSIRKESVLVASIARVPFRGWAEASTIELRFKKHGRGLIMTCDDKKFLIDRDVIEGIYTFVQEDE